MAVIILIPAVICWAVLAMSSARRALLSVYLPTLLLLPQYYVLRINHLPPLSFADAAMVPLGIALAAIAMRRWNPSWMDLIVLLLAACMGFSEALGTVLAQGEWAKLFTGGAPTKFANGGLTFVSGLLTIVLPYMAGKLLIESRNNEQPLMRIKFIDRMVVLLSIVALLSVFDFLTGNSGWQRIMAPLHLKQTETWQPQMRWGFGRIAGPYGHAILAGMIFLMGLVYCLWLRRVSPDWRKQRLIAGMPFTLRGLILTGVAAGLLMTQSRGPWIGVGLALVFAFLTRVFDLGRATILFLLFMALFSTAAFVIGNAYTSADITEATSVEQRDAIYRRQLLTNYLPVISERKAFGWGVTEIPNVAGQPSIDNQFLLLAVTDGLVGLGLFLAVVAGTGVHLLRLLARPMGHDDRLLVFAHMAVLIGLITTLTTVYLGEQVVALFFLFVGWAQAMAPAHALGNAIEGRNTAMRFRRVLV